MWYVVLSFSPLLPFVIAALLRPIRSGFSPLLVLFLIVIFGTVLKTGYLVRELATESGGGRLYGDWLIGVVANTIACSAFVVGFSAAGNRTFSPVFSAKPRLPRPLVKGLFLTLAFGSLVLIALYFDRLGVWDDLLSGRFIGRKFIVLEDGSRASVGYLSIGAEFALVIFCFALSHRRINKSNVIFYSFLILGTLGTYVFSSQRLSVLYVLLIVLICIPRSSKQSFSRVVLVLGTFGLIVTGTILRRIGQTGESLKFVEGISHTVEQAFARPYFLTVDKTGIIVNEVSSRSLYLYGESIYSLLTAPIPREFWLDKPAVRIGPWISEVVYGYNTISGIPPGLFGEFFLNFGWPGLVLGMFFWGFVSCAVYNRFLSNGPSIERDRVFYGIFYISFLIVAVVADINGGVLRFVKLYFAYLICCSYFQVTSPSPKVRQRGGGAVTAEMYGLRNPV